MPWIEVHQSLPTHAKTVEMAVFLDVPEVQVVGHLVCLWLWALDNAKEGVVRVDKPVVIAKAARWAGEPGRFVDALLGAGFLDDNGAIHDWDEYAGRLMERRERIQEQTRQRVQAYRDRKRLTPGQRGAGGEVTPKVTRYERYGNAPVTASNAPTVPNLTGPSESRTTPVESGPAREADASTPPTTTGEVASGKGSRRVAAVIDALRAEGMTGTLTPKDRQAIQRVAHDPQEVAALYVAIFKGEYGDPYMHDNLSVWLCLEKLPGWRSAQAGYQAPARRNGRPVSGSAAVSAAFEEALRGHGAAGGAGRERRGRRGPGMGDDETGDRVPRQLPG